MGSKIIFFVMGFSLLLACGKMPESRYYMLEWQALAKADAPVSQILHIRNFDAAPLLQGDKMMYKTSPYEICYDNYRRWAMPPTGLLRQMAADYFEASGLFQTVALDAPQDAHGYSLFGRVNHFEEINYGAQHRVAVAVNFELYDFGVRRPVLNVTIRKEAPISGSSAEDIAAAMSAAAKLVFDELAEKMPAAIQ